MENERNLLREKLSRLEKEELTLIEAEGLDKMGWPFFFFFFFFFSQGWLGDGDVLGSFFLQGFLVLLTVSLDTHFFKSYF